MTIETDAINFPHDLINLDRREALRLLDWISRRLVPLSGGRSENSYALKHLFQEETGCYVSNGQFKGAMLLMGWQPKDREAVNWSFRLVIRDDAGMPR